MSNRKHNSDSKRGTGTGGRLHTTTTTTGGDEDILPSGSLRSSPSFINSPPKVDLKKEYIRFCKLYSNEPLDIVSGPLEKASYGRDAIVVDLRGRGLRGVDCIALGKILSLDAPISQLILGDCLLLPQGFQVLIEGLHKNTRLDVLELRGNNIQGSMTLSLAKLLKLNNHLDKLMLDWNCIGTPREAFSAFCEGLTVNKKLRVLDLRNNQLTPESAVELARALQSNKSLRELDLRWNSIGLVGAKAIWEALRHNYTLSKIHLCGNFIPEEIVRCIELCLQEKSEREVLMEDYATRTTLLTRQLQTSERQHENELNTIVSVLEAEEAEHKEAIRESQEQLDQLRDQLNNEATTNRSLMTQIEKLHGALELAAEKEATLQKALEIKDEHSDQLESLFRAEMNKMKNGYEQRIKSLQEDLDSKNCDSEVFLSKLNKLETQLEIKTNEAQAHEERLSTMKKELAQCKHLYEEKVKAEKEKWNNWKLEVETAEKREINKLEEEIKLIQTKMTDHVRSIEKGKADAEEEIRHLKLSFITHKAQAEEDLTKLRTKLNNEHEAIVENLSSQLNTLRETVEKLENDLQKQSVTLRKYESENTTLTRQNENLRQQISHMDKELLEKESCIHSSLARARSEVREQIEQLGKEEEANKVLRAQVLELQEQIAILTLKQTREIQEKFSEMDHWKTQVGRREEELSRLKEEDMRRASLLHEAFLAYLRSTSAATGIPLPQNFYALQAASLESGEKKQEMLNAGDGPSTMTTNPNKKS